MRIKHAVGIGLVGIVSLTAAACSDSFNEEDLAKQLKDSGLTDEQAECSAAYVFDNWEDDDISEDDIIEDGEMTAEAQELFTAAGVECADGSSEGADDGAEEEGTEEEPVEEEEE